MVPFYLARSSQPAASVTKGEIHSHDESQAAERRRFAFGWRIGSAIQWWGDRQAHSDHAAGEAGGGGFGGQRAGARQHLPPPVLRRASPPAANPGTAGVFPRSADSGRLDANLGSKFPRRRHFLRDHHSAWSAHRTALGDARRHRAVCCRPCFTANTSRCPSMPPWVCWRGILGAFVEPEEIWSFTPFVDLSLYRWVRRILRRPRIDRQFLMLFLIVAAEACRDWIAREFPHQLFALRRNPALGAGARVDQRAHRRRHCAEGVERAAHRDEARRAEASSARSAARCTAAPDQSPLPLQHAQLHRIAGAHQAGTGPRDDGEAGQHSARAAQGSRHLCPAAQRN